jgi:hypothetical protein
MAAFTGSGHHRRAKARWPDVSYCINLEICKVSAGVVFIQPSVKDDSFTMLGASLMVRIVNPGVHHSDRPSAGYGVQAFGLVAEHANGKIGKS